MTSRTCEQTNPNRRFCRFFFLLPASLCMLIILQATGQCEELEMINRPVNSSGLTGLLVTTGPFTVPFKKIELGIGAQSERSTRPDYTLSQLPFINVTAGVSENSELTLHASSVKKTMAASTSQRGTGNIELSWKYAVLPQMESSSIPAVALFVSADSGGSNKDIKLNGIVHWGARVGLAAGKEITWGDHVIGLYADAQLAGHDLNNETLKDTYGLMDTGLLLPISKYRNLQLIIEYSISSHRDGDGGDYSALLYGLRLVTERFNLSIGSQFIRKKNEGFDNTSQIIAMMSLRM